ncbi:hypothetical protein GGI21_005074, partial [Coemansia aciculifera]
MDTKGEFTFAIPEDIPPKKYLLRPEFVTLQIADKEYSTSEESGAEYFPNCIQIDLISNGTAKPKGHAIPGIYKSKDPGILMNLWDDDLTKYQIPGPPLYTKELGITPPGTGNETKPDVKPPGKPTNP